MKCVYAIALILILASLCTKGEVQDVKTDSGKERHSRSLKSNEENAKTNLKNMTVVERWQSLENKIKHGANAAVKMVMSYMMQDSGGMNVSSQCMRDTMHLISGIKRLKPWAIRFLDASGKMIDGMFEGTLSSLGVYDECLDIEVFSEKARDKGKELFIGQYCTLELKLPVPPKRRYFKIGNILPELKNFTEGGTIINEAAKYAEFMNFISYRIGLCIPSGCSKEDLNQLAIKLEETTGFDTHVSRCEIKQENEIGLVPILVICVFVFLILLVATGTSFGIYSHFTGTVFKSMPVRILLCFNIMTNFEKLSETTNSSEALACLSGIRVITIIWIILAHSYLNINHHVFIGMKRAGELAKGFAFQVIINSTPSVDTFYTMSGFLVCYLTIKVVKIGKHPLNIKFYIIHRLFRLMPAYIFTMLYILVQQYFGSGPIWYDTTDKFYQYCVKNWWTNLIFINNFYDSSHMCIPQSWYIASDIQLYIAALIILIPMIRSARIGIFLTVSSIVACIIYSAVATVVLQLPYSMMFSRPDPDELQLYLSTYYFRPFAHSGPYCMGMLGGYILATYPKLKIPLKYLVIGWSLAGVSMFCVVYGIYEWNNGYEPTLLEGLLYASLHRSVWGFGVTWMIICCAYGHGGIVNYVLTWKAFIPLGKLTYIVFLIHPIIQITYIGNIRTLLQPDNLLGVYLFFGHTCTSYILAVGISMLVESPTLALQKLLEQAARKVPETSLERKSSVLNGNLRTLKNGDVAMIVPNDNTFNEMRGVDNEAAVYKL